MSRTKVDSPLAIEVELRSEMASALRRVARRVESLLEELAQTGERLRGTQGAERARLVARHAELRDEAEKQRWYLIVQREAMGLRQHEDIYALYRLPDKVQ